MLTSVLAVQGPLANEAKVRIPASCGPVTFSLSWPPTTHCSQLASECLCLGIGMGEGIMQGAMWISTNPYLLQGTPSPADSLGQGSVALAPLLKRQ